MDINALKEELAKPQYAALSHKDAASLLNALSVRVPKSLTMIGERKIFDLLGAADGEVFMQTVEALAASPPSPELVVFKRVDRWLKDATGLDIGSVEVQGILTAMSQGESPVFNPASVETLIEYGSQYTSIAQRLGLGVVGDGHVASAREVA